MVFSEHVEVGMETKEPLEWDIKTYDGSFNMAMQCTVWLDSREIEDKEKARQRIIRVLDQWKAVPSETYPIWTDIIESIGFYPYLDKNPDTMQMISFADIFRKQSFLSDYLPGIYLHKEQKKLSEYIREGKNVVASAPTSFGKSLLIEEIVASHKYRNIVVIQPTLALLDETRIKLKKYKDFYKIIIRTSQEASTDKGNLFLLTAERVMEYEDLPHIDFLIIDEFYKISGRRDDERSEVLNNAFLKITGKYHPQFYFLGPNIDSVTERFLKKYNAIFYKSHYSLVDCDVINKIVPVKSEEKEKCHRLYELLESLGNEQTLIYCSRPSRARKLAREFLSFLKDKGGEARSSHLPLIEWIQKNISENWNLAEELAYGIGFHDGSLQKHIASSIIQYFNEKQLRYIFCTSTIIEGVNTSAKNVVIFDGTKGKKAIDFFDYNNIKGRSGRLMEHYVGKVYNFVEPPDKTPIEIDIPFIDQNPIKDEILINLDKKDVLPEHKDRYDQLVHIEPGLLNIIRKNGVSVTAQKRIYEELQDILQTKEKGKILWTQLPDKAKIRYILTLAEESGLISIDHHGVKSVKQLAYFLSDYMVNHDIMKFIEDDVSKRISKLKRKKATAEVKRNYYDNAIEDIFHVYRHWFQFTVPKVFRVVDSLQRYACQNMGLNAGSYSYFVQQLENDFIPENLTILAEYGVPTSAIRKIASLIPAGYTEDSIFEYIRQNKDLIYSKLLLYEREKMDNCL